MKKFKFTLEVLLKTNKIFEAEIKKKLAEIMARYFQEMELLSKAEQERDKLQEDYNVLVLDGTNSETLNIWNSYIIYTVKIIHDHEVKLKKIEDEKIICQEELQKIMSEIKGLEKIKLKQYTTYQEEYQREQYLEIEEFVLFQVKQKATILQN